MPATAGSLRGLHEYHQRARAIRERLASGPKTLAAREKFLANRQAALEETRKALKDLKAHTKGREGQLQSLQDKIGDLRSKLNQTKKQNDYDAIRNQIAHDNASVSKMEDEILHAFTRIEEDTAALNAQEAEVKALETEVAQARAHLEAQAGPLKSQLDELESIITSAEQLIPADQRDQYLRVVKQRGADAMAQVEITDLKRKDAGACSGCFVAVTSQMMNELHLARSLTFCKTCGRILYLAEEDVNLLKR